MEPRDLPNRRMDESVVARILQAIGSPPNRRERPMPGDEQGCFDFWFDGGAATFQTGWTEYTFVDGTRARVAVTPLLSVTIELPNGRVVTVQQDR